MARIMWIALVCLIFICGLAALKFGIAAPIKQQDAFEATTVGANLQQAVFVKADKLDVNYVADVPEKKTVRVIPISLHEAEPAPAKVKVKKIITRHWHDGGTPPKRRARDSREATRPKHRG